MLFGRFHRRSGEAPPSLMETAHIRMFRRPRRAEAAPSSLPVSCVHSLWEEKAFGMRLVHHWSFA
ncbi:hypothetical protein [Geobacillus jurassicus]|uniref:Uncharacterized protein n=1 Tax=Geobacillus jurassicus TaxID=235932 RepID=A0ABV6GQF6_9BACL|nr:hypothetical protein [Geobacillus jurassicus]